MKKDTYELKLDSIEFSIQKARQFVEIEKQMESVLQPIFEHIYEWAGRSLADIGEIKEEHHEMLSKRDSGDEDAAITWEYHVDRIDKADNRQYQMSMVLLFADCHKSQSTKKHLVKDKILAKAFINSLLTRVELEIEPIVVFGNGFYVYDAGDLCIFSIPYCYLQSYEKWINFAHEVGHLLLKRKCSSDKMKLTKLLVDSLIKAPEDWTETIKALISWTDMWSQELLSDCIAILFSGVGYVNETILYSVNDRIDLGTKSHPPTGFRLAIQVEFLERLGLDVSKMEYLPSDPLDFTGNLFDKALLDYNLAPIVVDWIMGNECIKKLKSSWQSILNAIDMIREGEEPTMDFDVAFSALVYLTMYVSTESGFEFLRERAQREVD